ncbi:hypothetical protein E3N88_44235 [Mikania micrantha]|uniref:Uncharacterized protein n=1 Tax=Mikania micrantha TaxID=192012 RepID=A0A5N6LCN2_9ASTR|nr:hypothetical protein E3N88_44235 [Mikania micrantha]
MSMCHFLLSPGYYWLTLLFLSFSTITKKGFHLDVRWECKRQRNHSECEEIANVAANQESDNRNHQTERIDINMGVFRGRSMVAEAPPFSIEIATEGGIIIESVRINPIRLGSRVLCGIRNSLLQIAIEDVVHNLSMKGGCGTIPDIRLRKLTRTTAQNKEVHAKRTRRAYSVRTIGDLPPTMPGIP